MAGIDKRKRSRSAATSAAQQPGDPSTVADLVPDPSNRREHNARNVDMIAAALRDVGAARSIVIDERGEVLAGNGVVQAAAAAGITKVRVVDVDGDTLVAVRRSGLTADQRRRLAVYDNRTAELAEWDIKQLEADFQNGDDLTPFFTNEELVKLKVMPKPPETVGDQVVDGTFLVVITCATEAEQVSMLERFAAEGLECKALVS